MTTLSLYMGWKTIILGTECKVVLSLNRLKISYKDEYYTYPITDIDTIIFSHQMITITLPILSELIKNNVNVVICDSHNDPIGVFQGFINHSLAFKQLNKQINWKLIRKKKLWKLIVEEKIQSEIDACKFFGQYDSINQLYDYKKNVFTDDHSNREGSAAKVYYREMFGPKFHRDDGSVINIALNYGYKILASYISKCIVSRGLVTQLGIHHIGESNPFNLTYDFIEPFRALIDIWVKLNIDEHFTSKHKIDLVSLLDGPIYVNSKVMKLNDALTVVVDSYIAYMNNQREDIVHIEIHEDMYA